MKKIGLQYPVCALLSEDTGEPIYTKGMVMAKAMKVGLKFDKGDATVYADDSLDDVDQSITSGTETLDLNELTYEVQNLILGHELTDGELSVSSEDSAPNVGHGFIGKVKRDGRYMYRAVWLWKVQFSEPDDETETQGEKMKFQTPSVEGKIMKACNNKFKSEKTFMTIAEAKSWLNGKAGITPQCSTPTASVGAGSYDSAQTVTLTAGVGETIYYTTNGLTPTTTATKYTEAITVSTSTMLKAISIKDGSSNSDVASFEYVITQ